MAAVERVFGNGTYLLSSAVRMRSATSRSTDLSSAVTAFDPAAARAMLEAAREGDTGSAEMATGYYWGEDRLKPFVEEILVQARVENDERLIQLAERFVR